MSVTETEETERNSSRGAASDSEGDRSISKSDRRIVTVALLLAMAVAALEQTVVSTAMTSIIAQLKGIRIYPWVFSAYLLASTISTPIYGKLADLIGRRRVLLFGLFMFSVGSMLSGLSRSMPQLIAFRVIQGLGAGALGPIVLTIISDLYPLHERPKVQGLFSAIWGVSSVVGPLVGGVLTDQLSWRWVFFLTVPFSAFSAWILVRRVSEVSQPKGGVSLDWRGAMLLAAGSAALLWVVLSGRDQPIAVIAVGFAVAVALFILFVRHERSASDPILPIELATDPAIAAALVGNFLVGCLLFGLEVYVPLYMQGVKGGSATRAGGTMTPLFLTWSVSVAVAAFVVVRYGFRKSAAVGTLFLVVGTFFLFAGSVWSDSYRVCFLFGMIAIGLGMGPTSLSYLLSVQNAVPWNRRGAATGALIFSRTMGGSIGVGLLGASLGFELAGRLKGDLARGIDVAAALRPETHRLLGGATLKLVQGALGGSLQHVFLEMFLLTVAGIACVYRLPGGRPTSYGATERAEIDEGAAIAVAEAV